MFIYYQTIFVVLNNCNKYFKSLYIYIYFLQALRECLYYALELKLKSDFTPEVREAWVALYSIIENNMKIGMSQQAKKEDA